MNQEPSLFKREWNEISDRKALMRAVVIVNDRLAADDEEPGSDSLLNWRKLFQARILPPLLAEWSAQTEKPPEMMPWNEDFLVYTWMSWRKTLKQYIPGFREQFGLPVETDLFSHS